MKEYNYAFQNTDTRPGLQSRTQNICFVISISAVILKRMVKITSIFGSYSFLRIALHDIFSLSHDLLTGGVRTTIAKHHERYSKSDHLSQDGVE